ncbi:MAG: ATP-binding protein [Deltaproteobacteria bacterium]|jgi:hypothetical protein|nr:ATP-binding protein [Deltaproteobacteria bacterium]
MGIKLPYLPVGTQDFDKFRAKNGVYVDKTSYFRKLTQIGEVVFCARPRRFGKSLTVSTLDAYFSGKTELFKGLAIERFMKSRDFTPKPVINLTMSRPSGGRSIEIFEEKVIEELRRNAERHGVALRSSDVPGVFSNLILDIKKARSQNVVILIDEYDAPVIKIIQDPALAKIKDLLKDTRSIMSNFYSKIKDEDSNIDFVFITGVTKFSSMGVFSTLNNLKDISLLPEFAALLGFTQEELENNFMPFIRKTADRLCLTETELLAKIKDYYDGFSFDGETRLYNPFSALNFLGDMEFNNYWMESGSNTLIREILRDKGLTVDQFRNYPVNKDFARSPGEIDAIPPEGFLYQAGYLTLRKKQDSSFSLDYPNFEVRSSMYKLFIQNVYKTVTLAGEASEELKEHLSSGDVKAIVEDFRRLYYNISYIDHVAAMRRLKIFQAKTDHEFPEVARLMKLVYESDDFEDVKTEVELAMAQDKYDLATRLLDELINKYDQDNLIRHKMNESYYRSLLQSFLLGAGINVSPERHTNMGRSDLIIEYKNMAYVLELKVVEKTKDAETAAETAMSQIIEKNYSAYFGNPILLALAFSNEKRNIVAGYHAKGESYEKLDIGIRFGKVKEAFAEMAQAKTAMKTEKKRHPKS